LNAEAKEEAEEAEEEEEEEGRKEDPPPAAAAAAWLVLLLALLRPSAAPPEESANGRRSATPCSGAPHTLTAPLAPLTLRRRPRNRSGEVSARLVLDGARCSRSLGSVPSWCVTWFEDNGTDGTEDI
jgi:hypothetical protein